MSPILLAKAAAIIAKCDSLTCRGCGQAFKPTPKILLEEHMVNVECYGEEADLQSTLNNIAFCEKCA